VRAETSQGGLRWVSGRERYEAAHIPNARFADLLGAFSEPGAPTLFTHAAPQRFAAAAAALGVGPLSEVVVYDRADNMWAARLAWQFRALGFARVRVLDGGFATWRRDGGAVESGSPAVEPAEPFAPSENPSFWADREDGLAIVEGRRSGTPICALRPSVFVGAEVNYARPGHIPGSLNAPHAATLDAKGRYLGGEKLALALGATLDAPGPLVLYCGGGIAASGLALALALAGRTDVAIYDGSLSEWSADPALPLVTLV
jgi:thiosulfate/3-mercaptopyruvate sulfurtransferase